MREEAVKKKENREREVRKKEGGESSETMKISNEKEKR
jgi:hypothetical protein